MQRDTKNIALGPLCFRALGTILALSLCVVPAQTLGLAPPSAFQEVHEDLEKRYSREDRPDKWLAALVAIILVAEQEEGLGPKGRIDNIYERVYEALSPTHTGLIWEGAFATEEADYFDFEMGGDRFRLRFKSGQLGSVDAEELAAQKVHAVYKRRLPARPRRIAQADKQKLRTSSLLLREAVQEGRLLVMPNLLETDVGRLFRGSLRSIASEFAQRLIRVEREDRAEVADKMVQVFGGRDGTQRAERAFLALQQVLQRLRSEGIKGLDDLRVALIIPAPGKPPLSYTRTEEGQPLNVMAHTGRRRNSIFFDLDAIEFFLAQEDAPYDALELIVRMENAFLQDRDFVLNRAQRLFLNGLQERFVSMREVLTSDQYAQLQEALAYALEDAKGAGLDQDVIPAMLEDAAQQATGERDLPMQWHLVQSGKIEHYLFTIAGKRVYIGWDNARQETVHEFEILRDLYHGLAYLVAELVPSLQVTSLPDSSWETISEAIRNLYLSQRSELVRRGHLDMVRLLEYVMALDNREGFLEEIEVLSKRIRNTAQVPEIFATRPLAGREFVLLETVGHWAGESKDHKVFQITAIRYRGMRPIQKHQVFVKQLSAAAQAAAIAEGLDPVDLRSADLSGQDAALTDLRTFIAGAPVLTLGRAARTRELNDYAGTKGMAPIIASPISLEGDAKKILDPEEIDYPFDRHSMSRVLSYLLQKEDVPEDLEGLHGFTRLRLTRLVLEELVSMMRREGGPLGSDESFRALRARMYHSQRQNVLNEKFMKVGQEHPGLFLKVSNWEALHSMVLETDPARGGVEVLVLDFDNTIAKSMGWVGSDEWFRLQRLLLEEELERMPASQRAQAKLDFYEHLDKVNAFLIKMGYFTLMDDRIPEVVRLAQSKGIKVMVLTARYEWPGHRASLHRTLELLDVPIAEEDMVLAGDEKGHVDKSGKLLGYLTTHYERMPRFAFKDDGLPYQVAMAEHPELSKALHRAYWYDFHPASPDDRSYEKFYLEALERLAEDPAGSRAMGSLLNAFGLAIEQASPAQAIRMARRVLHALEEFQGDPYFSASLREEIAYQIRNNPPLRRAVVIEEMRALAMGQEVHFEDFFDELRARWGDLGLDRTHAALLIEDPILAREMDMRVLVRDREGVDVVQLERIETPVPAVHAFVLRALRGLFQGNAAQAALIGWLRGLRHGDFEALHRHLQEIIDADRPQDLEKALFRALPAQHPRRSSLEELLRQSDRVLEAA